MTVGPPPASSVRNPLMEVMMFSNLSFGSSLSKMEPGQESPSSEPSGGMERFAKASGVSSGRCRLSMSRA